MQRNIMNIVKGGKQVYYYKSSNHLSNNTFILRDHIKLSVLLWGNTLGIYSRGTVICRQYISP